MNKYRLKKWVCFFVFAVLLCVITSTDTQQARAVTFDEINAPNIFVKQVTGDSKCTLAAAVMLLRRAAIMTGKDWTGITLDSLMEQAWVKGTGLKWNFTYEGIDVSRASFGSQPEKEAIELLKLHPEGIVIYDKNKTPRPHAVLLTDYTNGGFYYADPVEKGLQGRITETDSTVKVKEAQYYWYVSNPKMSSLSTSPIIVNNSDDEAVSNLGLSEKLDINTYQVELSQRNFIYDGTEKKPAITISGLNEGTDYMVSYMNNIQVGTAYAVIIGIGAFRGSRMELFEITQPLMEKISESNILSGIDATLSKTVIKKGKAAAVKIISSDQITLVNEFSSNRNLAKEEIKLSYKSDNIGIAEVDKNGKIKGKKKGTTNINVTVALHNGSCRRIKLVISVI